MKKFISCIALGAVLVTGFFFTQNAQEVEVAIFEHEPSILSITSTI